MRSDAIIIVGVGFQDPTQMHLAQDNDVVHAFTPDRSDQPFGKAILPRRGRCGRLVPDAHGAQSARGDRTIDAIPAADHVARSFIPREVLKAPVTIDDILDALCERRSAQPTGWQADAPALDGTAGSRLRRKRCKNSTCRIRSSKRSRRSGHESLSSRSPPREPPGRRREEGQTPAYRSSGGHDVRG